MTAREPTNFFSLPAEIRYPIYDLVFDDSLVVKITRFTREEWDDPYFEFIWAKEGRIHSSTSYMRAMKRSITRAIDPRTLYGAPNGYAMCFSSRQAYAECVEYLYQRTKFAFRSQKPFHNFVTVTNPLGLANVTKLHLELQTYGDSSTLEHAQFKDRQRRIWSAQWKNAAQVLINLRNLTIVLEVNSVPLRFTLSEDWVLPILHFAACPLESAEVRLATGYRPRKRLIKMLADLNTPPDWNGIPPSYPLSDGEQHHCAIHRLFESAIEKKLLSSTDMDDAVALQDFRTACRTQYRNFNYPYLIFAQYDH